MEKLNTNSISFIYSEPLYNIGDQQVATSEENTTTSQVVKEPEQTYSAAIPVEGNANNGVLIINNETADSFINQNDKAFLTKIIGATKNDLNNCALVNAYRKKVNLEDLTTQTKATKVITFGVNLFDIGVQDSAPLNYECSNMPSGVIIIPADNLSDISSNADKKKALWIALQRMFSL